MLLALLCDFKAWFVSDLVINPNCWFSRAQAHLLYARQLAMFVYLQWTSQSTNKHDCVPQMQMESICKNREEILDWNSFKTSLATGGKVVPRQVFASYILNLSRLLGKPTMWFPNRSDTNQPVQVQKRARSLKFRI